MTTLNHGICFSPYQNGQNPNVQSQIPASQIDMLVQLAAPYFQWFLTYGTLCGLDHTGTAVHNAGRKCAAGAYVNQKWIDASNQQVAKLIQMANAKQCDQVIVGNEAILQGMTAEQLVGFIQTAKSGITTGVPISTALISGNWMKHASTVAPLVDVCNIHIYPWWENIRDVNGALTRLASEWTETVNAIHAVSPGKPCYLGETGWPNAGDPAATLKNQQDYFHGVQSWAATNNIDVFWFEMIDEAWKSEGSIGANWGIWGTANPGQQPRLLWPNPPVAS